MNEHKTVLVEPSDDGFAATLGDARMIERADLEQLAAELVQLGYEPEDVRTADGTPDADRSLTEDQRLALMMAMRSISANPGKKRDLMGELSSAHEVIKRQEATIAALRNQLGECGKAALVVEEKIGQQKADYEEHLHGVIEKLWIEIEKAQARADRYGILLAKCRAGTPGGGREAALPGDAKPSD